MKFTDYFSFTKQRADRQDIQLEWIEQTFAHPEKETVQADGRFRRWAYIEAAQKYLRIVVLEDGETIHNAFFDRSYKPD